MTDQTLADELRAAARLLRETAAAPEATEAWIALMSPAAAAPDADLFEVIADFAEQYDIRGHVDGEPCSDFACRIVHAALTSARAITGSTS